MRAFRLIDIFHAVFVADDAARHEVLSEERCRLEALMRAQHYFDWRRRIVFTDKTVIASPDNDYFTRTCSAPPIFRRGIAHTY